MSVSELMEIDSVSANGVDRSGAHEASNGTATGNGKAEPKPDVKRDPEGASNASVAVVGRNGTIGTSGFKDIAKEVFVDSKPGAIPHITANIVPLSNILKFYAQESFKQLTTVIENLSVNTTDLDSKRKNQFLQVIIALRQDFLKVYTLVKWASVSKDVSKLIDLLNWFRVQDLFFENLGYGINELNRFLGAKLPNPDLLTSIEVLIEGRPQLPSYNLIPQKPISTEKALKVLKELNLVLSTRMALIEGGNDQSNSGWLRMLDSYEVKDGRIYFTIKNEFQVSISIANDIIVYDHQDKEEYSKSPFYFVDFKFLFGINPETLLITHQLHNKDVVTKLPQQSFRKLEVTANQVLLEQGLEGIYDILHRYSISFKLYLISRQLRELALNSKWRGNIQYQYQKSLIIINYWSSHYLSQKWKSFVEIGVDRNYNLNFRWFKNGTYIDHGIQGVFQGQEALPGIVGLDGDASAETNRGGELGDFSVEMILNIIANKHSEGIIEQIHQRLAGTQHQDDISKLISPHQLLIKLTPTKSTVFAINPLTGYFYFIDPSPIQQQSTRNINNPPPAKSGSSTSTAASAKFISEEDMIAYIIEQIFHLRLETFKREINTKLITTEWISNEIIKLNEQEVSKLSGSSSDANKIQYYRRKNWPSSWFLMNLIDGINFKSFWWVARIKSIKGEWKIQWVEKIEFAAEVDQVVTFQYCSDLSTTCSNMIIDHIILEELISRKIKYVKISNKEAILNKFNIQEPPAPILKDGEEVIYESLIGLFNNHLVPVGNSTTIVVLKVQLKHHPAKGSVMRLSVFGKLRNFAVEFSSDVDSSIKLGNNFFEVIDEFPMNTTIASEGMNASFLTKIFQNLSKLDNLINIINQLNHFNSAENIRTISLNQIEFTLDKEFGKICILIEDSGIVLTNDSQNKLFKPLITYINRYLTNSSNVPITGVIKYIQQILPPLKIISHMKNEYDAKQLKQAKLNNGINKVNFDISFKSFESIFLNFGINSFQPQSKRMVKDKITFKISIKTNKFFDKGNKILYFISYKSNFTNTSSMKYKKLFEAIYNKVNELKHQEVVKLNYDILLSDSKYLETVLEIISNCCVEIFNENNA